ncbi:MAG TPA: methylated-DNA--[protein]-cysteine S-methyltransferase [Longimicrobiaceae bacterium]|nr:methylated-DNA--[protein]-cysteine S-methyltransferase [Longimicrobiaceae bacterium]
MTLYASHVPSPLGRLTVLVDEGGALARILFSHEPLTAEVAWDDAHCGPAAAQLTEYFAGRRREFDLPLAPAGSAFQQQVWAELRGVPYGETADYRRIAERVGRPGAARAVGRANATNPIPIVIPCHRVVGADGSLTGYAGGLGAKRTLLELEGALAPA